MTPGGGPSDVPALRIRRLFATLLFISLLGAMNVTIVGASLATIVGELGGLDRIAWTVTAFTLAGTVIMPVFGQLGDLWGRRGLFLWAIAIFALGSLLCGVSVTMTQLSLARVVQGLGGAGVSVLSQTILADVIPARNRAKYASLMGSVFGVATVAGPVAGGVLTDTVGWRWIFLANVPLALVGLALAWRTMPRIAPRGTGGRFDAAGAALLGLAVTGLVVMVTFTGSAWAWRSPTGLAVLAGTLVATVLFVLVEQRVLRPIVPFVMFRDPGVAPAMVLGLVTGAGMLSLVAYLPAFVQMRYGVSATVAGAAPIAIVAGLIMASNYTGVRISRTGHYRVYPIAGSAVAAAALLVLGVSLRDLSLPLACVLLGFMGLGTGAFMQLVTVLIQNGAPDAFVGVATSTTNLVRQIGATLGSAAIGAFLGATVVRLLSGVVLPGGGSVESLTPEVLAHADEAVRLAVADAYASAMVPILIGMALVYSVGIVAAVRLPALELAQGASPGSTRPR